MQSQLLCLTTLLCSAATLCWMQFCNANIVDSIVPAPSVQIYLQDQEIEQAENRRTLVKSLLIKPSDMNSPTPMLAKNHGQQVDISDKKEKNESNSTTRSRVDASLPEISRLTILHHYGIDENSNWKKLTLDELADKFVVKSEHKRDAGLFVTLIKDGDTRACWGSINANHKNLVRATVFTTEEALTKDYRYTKIKKSEINHLIPQVTVVKRIVPINSISTMRPLKQGLMVRAGGKGAVLLPGEASDPHYQLVKTKLKAGIPSSQPCQLYRIEADVYR